MLGRAGWTGPGAAAGHRHLPGRRMVGHRRARAGRPDAGRTCHRPRRGAESPDRGLRAAAPRHLRHPGRRHRRRAGPDPGGRRRGPHRVHRDDVPSRHRAAGAAARADRAAGRPARPGPGGGAGGACPAGRLLRRRPAPHGDPDHRRGAGAGSRPAGCGPGARAGPPGRPSPPAAGPGADRPPGAPVPAADAGRRRSRSPGWSSCTPTMRPPEPAIPGSLATALVLLATAASPASALAAGATDAVQRIHRLLGPAEPLGRPAGSCCAPPPRRSP